MSDEVLRQVKDQGVLTLWLNRPEKRNALNGPLIDALSTVLAEADASEDIRVILLRGEGPDFCAGADLTELEAGLNASPEENLADARRLGALFLQMRSHSKPILSVVQGRALGGGCGLATASDLILAREDAEFGYPEVHLGFVPAIVTAILRKKVTEGRAFELATLGRRFSADEGHRLGLVNRVFPAQEFEAKVMSLAMDLAALPPSAIQMTKAVLYQQADLTMAQGVERGAQVNAEARQTEAFRAGVRAFLAKKGSREG
jgi:methylglutaconyl-CoA hydratase